MLEIDQRYEQPLIGLGKDSKTKAERGNSPRVLPVSSSDVQDGRGE
jgi:hypothetical protein